MRFSVRFHRVSGFRRLSSIEFPIRIIESYLNLAPIIAVYNVLAKHKKTSAKDDLILKYYLESMGLMGLSLVIVAVAVQKFTTGSASKAPGPRYT